MLESYRITKILQKRRATQGQPELTEEELDLAIDAFLAENSIYEKATEVQITVTEGKNRMVRRMLHKAGHTVVFLHRVRYGGVCLGDLPESSVRAINDVESDWLINWATEYDNNVKEKMERKSDPGKHGVVQLDNEAKMAVAFVRDEAIKILTKMRKTRKSQLEKQGLLKPKDEIRIENSCDKVVKTVVKSWDQRSEAVRNEIAEKLADYAATRPAPLSNRALTLATKQLNKVILIDKREEKKWTRLRSKKMRKESAEKGARGRWAY